MLSTIFQLRAICEGQLRACRASSWRASCSVTSAAPSRAHKLKIGKFGAAHRGTIFLDEIGDLHPMLRRCPRSQDGEFSRIGGKSTLSVDVRSCATNQNLEGRLPKADSRDPNTVSTSYTCWFRAPRGVLNSPDQLFVEQYETAPAATFTVPLSEERHLTHHRYRKRSRTGELVVGRPRRSLHGRSRSPTPARTGNPRPPSTPGLALTTQEPSLRGIGRRACQAAERVAIAKTLEQTGWNRVRAARALRISYRALLYKIKQAGLDAERSAARSAL